MASIDVIKELLNAGEDPNKVIKDVQNNTQKSYLFCCIDDDNQKLVSFLIEKGADPSLPLCSENVPPLHYAIMYAKNNAVLALLESGADPNIPIEKNGNTPLTTAIKCDNNVALKYLIQFEADVNIPNNRGETPLLHAIHKGNNYAVNLLLENHAEMANSEHSALHFAAKEGQAESCLLLMKYGIKRDLQDNHDRTALEYAERLEDPTTELLLRTPNLPQTTLDVNYVRFLNDSFEPKIEEIRDQMAEAQTKFPKHMKSFISTLKTLERCHTRFVAFLKNRAAELQELVDNLSKPTKENVDKDIDRLSVQLYNSIQKEIQSTAQCQDEFGQELFSPAGIESYERWVKRNEEMQQFIEELVSTGLDKYGLKDDVANKLRKARQDYEYVSSLSAELAAKTVPFQEEIVAFTTFAVRKLKTMELKNPPEVYENFFKQLARQIKETNPELIRRQFQRPSQKQ
ncbi:calcium ion binding [Trichomonas vaginalis G3]|uniref:calcium ion binding n=1 Tax=Trichomonas vaginalis (strain ATCC PRA-98 / G3) TaxID=412133 RepID=UPI0021E5733A|nr:calcium ion binding [Trichomonas vaginalis G3]KAI5489526.1 calcium ion binding [Trichomonas vaginalis G3]